MQAFKPREIRQAAGLSLAKVAARADVSEPTARIFEIDPNAVKDVRKRESLGRVYGELSRSRAS